ncbi:hypothetical protein P5673_024808 [Acropora cervicornis]|uniref:Uncharacterized protein n=1 Tax=Acropora cervicornis TaxID=6130 RepID=A0AAD9Q318_ACRCE|nr:hypothetical protein P5673_024808 [Acropora cervicornis]
MKKFAEISEAETAFKLNFTTVNHGCSLLVFIHNVCVSENTPAYKIHVSEEIWTSQRATSGIQIFQNAPLGGLVTAIQNQRSGNSN